ncbi:MAG: hypothetical protein HY722_09350 [Planctomycetes bacterium]|nr:hypothetical protein [Planctomycetota bacterium]
MDGSRGTWVVVGCLGCLALALVIGAGGAVGLVLWRATAQRRQEAQVRSAMASARQIQAELAEGLAAEARARAEAEARDEARARAEAEARDEARAREEGARLAQVAALLAEQDALVAAGYLDGAEAILRDAEALAPGDRNVQAARAHLEAARTAQARARLLSAIRGEPPAGLPEAAREALRRATAVDLEVTVEEGDPPGGFREEVLGVTRGFIQRLGLGVGGAEVRLEVAVSGTAVSAEYEGAGDRYTGADVSGTLRLWAAGALVHEAAFEGSEPTPFTIFVQPGQSTAPGDAPFGDALLAGSFLDALVETASTAWGMEEIHPWLAAAEWDDYPLLQGRALERLCDIADPRSLDALLRHARSVAYPQRGPLAAFLAEHHDDPRVLPALLEMLAASEPMDRPEVVAALAELGNPAAIAPLERLSAQLAPAPAPTGEALGEGGEEGKGGEEADEPDYDAGYDEWEETRTAIDEAVARLRAPGGEEGR